MVKAPSVKALTCPNCGGEVTVRALGHAVNVICSRCGSVLDAKSPGLEILQRSANRQRITPTIPLGTRGTIEGATFEVIGFQVRSISDDGQRYSWDEYLLFNPYQGFRYLTAYQGHWNVVRTVHAIPVIGSGAPGGIASLGGTTYRHFQTAVATTDFVLGEFPWQVRAGDRVTASDYVAPPLMLSSELTNDEETWSSGTYTPGSEIWRAFKLAGAPPTPRGIYANQPADGTTLGALWKLCGAFAACALLVFLLHEMFARRETALVARERWTQTWPDSGAYVTDRFDLRGRTSNVEVEIDASVANSWIFLGLALINEQTGTAYDFGREVSYYSGYDEDGSWTEGSTTDRAVIPSVPPGRYYLRVEPEGAPEARGGINYRIVVRRDVPTASWLGLALLALLLPPIVLTVRRTSTEVQRWNESDHPRVTRVDASDE
jgi:transcription initiation factor TFIIIB Brf1 subunit/transcription initiation factor TFIIB